MQPDQLKLCATDKTGNNSQEYMKWTIGIFIKRNWPLIRVVSKNGHVIKATL